VTSESGFVERVIPWPLIPKCPPDRWTYRDGKDRCPACSNRSEEIV
jgi:hypothetical protein